MILPDTSVWIEFFRQREPVHTRLRNLLELGEIAVYDLIFAELLQGTRNRRESDVIRDYFDNLHDVSSPSVALKAGLSSGENKWPEKGIGLIDACIITCARSRKMKIWSLDKKLVSVLKANEVFKP